MPWDETTGCGVLVGTAAIVLGPRRVHPQLKAHGRDDDHHHEHRDLAVDHVASSTTSTSSTTLPPTTVATVPAHDRGTPPPTPTLGPLSRQRSDPDRRPRERRGGNPVFPASDSAITRRSRAS